ncbi:MAG: biopolymer transporter ExbD [Phycisphaeraceae bacterium]|nr:biopolymer transporter ExbD [Phycisphaeraceae bacterium]MBX3368034.1 biopolymer transporter ExbD [Phycisphaeraceae bacterium]
MRPIRATSSGSRYGGRPSRSASTAPDSLPDMTPMVDVVMVILIFFMASTALVGPELVLRARIATDDAPAAAEPLIAPASLAIRLRTDARATLATGLGLTDAPIESLIAHIQARTPMLRAASIPIIIDAAPTVPYQSVVDTIDALERAGVRDIALR